MRKNSPSCGGVPVRWIEAETAQSRGQERTMSPVGSLRAHNALPLSRMSKPRDRIEPNPHLSSLRLTPPISPVARRLVVVGQSFGVAVTDDTRTLAVPVTVVWRRDQRTSKKCESTCSASSRGLQRFGPRDRCPLGTVCAGPLSILHHVMGTVFRRFFRSQERLPRREAITSSDSWGESRFLQALGMTHANHEHLLTRRLPLPWSCRQS